MVHVAVYNFYLSEVAINKREVITVIAQCAFEAARLTPTASVEECDKRNAARTEWVVEHNQYLEMSRAVLCDSNGYPV